MNHESELKKVRNHYWITFGLFAASALALWMPHYQEVSIWLSIVVNMLWIWE